MVTFQASWQIAKGIVFVMSFSLLSYHTRSEIVQIFKLVLLQCFSREDYSSVTGIPVTFLSLQYYMDFLWVYISSFWCVQWTYFVDTFLLILLFNARTLSLLFVISPLLLLWEECDWYTCIDAWTLQQSDHHFMYRKVGLCKQNTQVNKKEVSQNSEAISLNGRVSKKYS